MANMFTGDNDHGDKVLPLSDLLWEEVTKLRQEIVRLNNVINEITTQRDYARREVCWLLAEKTVEPTRLKLQWFAADRGWDCFKEEEACDTLSQEVSQEVSQEGDKLPATISANGIRITEYLPPQMSVREIPPHAAYTTGECTLHNISVDKSYQKISTQHKDLFQKLAQEKKTNG